ncbi:MAG: hypothetical protein Q8P20_02005 [bacterium]|nr:hypothetical protein [bacterium]
MEASNNDISSDSSHDKIFHAATFFITWLVFCLIAGAGYLWGIDSAATGVRYSPLWFFLLFLLVR